MVKRGVVEHISPSSVGRLLQAARLKPHKTRYWLNSPEQGTESFQNASQTVCALYQNAAEWHQQGIHVISTDEKTGIQALERLHPTQPMEPKVQSCERREHSYERHGTQTLIANFEVATGRVIHPTIGDTRTEKDFVEHIEKTMDTDPDGQWIFIVDQLNTHQSASLVERVAERCNIKEDLGKKGKEGILESMNSRKQFLEDKSHRIRFVYTPKHASWLNQVEIWFSTLTRRLLRRGSFSSIEKLQARILSFIEFFNKTMAKPFKWIYTGRPLAA
jgi:transposase